MEYAYIRMNGGSDYHFFARSERILDDLEIRTILQDITPQETSYGNERKTHRSSLDHGIHHPSGIILHSNRVKLQCSLKIWCMTILLQRTKAGLVCSHSSRTDQEVNTQTPTRKGNNI
jgi:hypothetical protein